MTYMDDDTQTSTVEPAVGDTPIFDLKLDDTRLVQMMEDGLDKSIAYWNKAPWNLEQADKENLDYWLGKQMPNGYMGLPNMGNRMQTSSRAVLAYVNARVANPELAPSNSSEEAKQFARDVRAAMHQHGVDYDLEELAGKSTFNLLIQKRGYLKLRFDPLAGPDGDVVPEHVAPEDIVMDKDAVWKGDPGRIWHKQRATVEELVMKFPGKTRQIYAALGIKRGIYTQMTQRVVYWECWFTYYEDNKRKEGLAWYMPTGKVILGKMPNPNYIYTGDDKQDRIINFSAFPIKPFTTFSYMNIGKGAIDETSLFEQVKVLQDLYNKRKQQIFENNDYVNGRMVMDKRAVGDGDADKFFSKNPKAILLIDPKDSATVQSSVFHVPHNPLPPTSTEEAYDLRNEIDTGMGTPNIFRGEQSKNNTLGQDERIIEQAGALQDDLAKAVDKALQDYYRKLFQMMKVYYTEDHWIQVKGDDGKYDFVVMNSDTMDTNVKVSVESGSTLPTNKREVRDIATTAANANKIDDLSFWEAVQYGRLPDPETIVERTQKQLNDPARFLSDVESQLFNREAATDIALIKAGKEPPVRDDYGQAYLEFFNRFITSPRFIQVDESVQEALKLHVAAAGATAARTANLEATQVDDAAAAGVPEAAVQEQMV